jgi:hypothetical protein
MKWREPWRNTLQRQPPLKPFSRQNLRNAAVWTTVFAGFLVLSVLSGKATLSEAAGRSWLVLAFGFGLAGLQAVAHWLSPLEVSSGPRGIVRSKGEALALIPWSAIRSHRFYLRGTEQVLELEVTYSQEPERLYLPPKVNVSEVESEIRSHVRAEA